MNSQARAFLLAAREAERCMPASGRIVAITYAPGGAVRQLAIVGRHGRREIGDGVARPLLRRRAGAARHHRERAQPRMDSRTAC